MCVPGRLQEMDESWKQHLDTIYDVSDLGRIRNRKSGLILKLTPNTGGYLCWTCCHNGEQATIQVHAAVAIAFIPNPDAYETVDHKKSKEITNNCVSNLRWANRSMQNHNRAVYGAVPFKGVCKNGKKYVAQITIDGKNVYIGIYDSPEEASQAYNTRFSAEGFDVI